MQSDSLLLINADLGSVGDYDPAIALNGTTSKGPLRTGGVYLGAALNQMVHIQRLCESLEEDHRELIRETKDQYDALNRQKKELELLGKRKSILKPLKFMEIRRAKQAFLHETKRLWISTLTTSERLKRTLLSVPAEELVPVESESVGKDEPVRGLVIPQPSLDEMNNPDTQEALAAAQKVASILASSRVPLVEAANLCRQTIDAARDPEALSSTRSNISTSPSSPGSSSGFGSLSVSLNFNVVHNTDSTAPFTINNNGSENSGSTIIDRCQDSANSPPS